MPDYRYSGQVNGLSSLLQGAQPINEAADANQKQQTINLAKKNQLADFLQKGVNPDASGLNAKGQAIQGNEIAQANFNKAGVDPTSDRSSSLSKFLGKAPSNMGQPNIAAADAEKVQPVIDSAIKAKSAVDVYGKKQGQVTDKILQKDQSSLLSDPSYKQAQKGLDDGQLAKGQLDLAQNGNAIASGAMPIVMAKLKTGTSRLNQQEIAAFGGSKAVDARITQAMQQAQTGTLTKDNAQFLGGIIDKDTQIHKSVLHQATMTHAMQRSQRTHKPVSDSYQELSGQSMNPVENTGQGEQPPRMPIAFDPNWVK